MASTQIGRSVHRPVKTCTECKQVKLRCDSKEKFPAPCSRCHTRNLQCVVDSSFRRTPARKRVEEMARELEALKSQKGEDSTQKSTVSPSNPESFDSPDHTLESSGTALLDDSGLSEETYQLGEFFMAKDGIVEVFRIFCDFFYPHFPVLDPQISISSIYSSSPFLFWTITVIVLERPVVPSHHGMLGQLNDPYLQLLRGEILRAPVPISTIQALTYLIMWPLRQRRQVQDPSWLYSGVAVNAALYMGLHRAKPAQSLRSIGVPPGSVRARATTWLGCFLASTALGMHVGVSPPIHGISDLATIEHFIRNFPVPPEFGYQIMVHHTLAKFTNVILESSQDAINFSLIKVIDNELDGLKMRFPTTWNHRAEMSLLTAKMHLYTMVIIRMQSDRASREILMKMGFSVALRIIYLTDQGLNFQPSGYDAVGPEGSQGSLPKNYFRLLILATCFLLRFFALNSQASQEEQEVARNHVAIAQRYFKAGALGPTDEKARGAALVEMLSRQKPVDLDISKLRVDDRLGASLVYDAITTGHEIRNLVIEAEENLPTQQTAPPAIQIVQGASVDNQGLGFDLGQSDGYDQMNFSLPEDLWGDSVWGIFDNMAPTYMQPYN